MPDPAADAPARSQRRLSPGRVRGVMALFVGLHSLSLLALWPTIARGEALGDLVLYRDWAVNAFRGDEIMGITTDWVYPLMAWLPIGVANLFGPNAYQIVWFAMVTILNFFATALLLRASADARHPYAAYVWLGTIAVLSPVAMLRLEGVVAPVVVMALLVLSRFPFIAGVMLAVATWIKVWPAAVIAAVVAARRGGGRIIPAGIIVTAGITVVASLTGGLSHLMSFLSLQTSRALQIESPLATIPMVLDGLGGSGFYQYYNKVLLTTELGGPVPELVAVMSTPLMLAMLLIVAVLIWLQGRRGVDTRQLMLTGALALATALFVLNKVGSPQFMLWILPIVVVGMVTTDSWWSRPAMLTVAASVLTTIVFPLMYPLLLQVHLLPILILAARNALLVWLLVIAVIRLVRFRTLCPTPTDDSEPSAGPDAVAASESASGAEAVRGAKIADTDGSAAADAEADDASAHHAASRSGASSEPA
ncbi:MAG: glycosyltransferase 87 family protein [Agrococcus casei]|uniref:glycosyltransferase 87 family protein n=1 Tax=Agrococcus casei TaxID=343512 RepID=UPI003F9330F5